VQNLVGIDTVVSIYTSFTISRLGLENAYSRPKIGVFGDLTPLMGNYLIVTPKGTVLARIHCTGAPLPMKAKFGALEETQGLHLDAKYHLNMFIVSASGGQKPQFWANLTFGGSMLYRHHLLPMRAEFSALEQTHGIRLRAECGLDRFILSPSNNNTDNF